MLLTRGYPLWQCTTHSHPQEPEGTRPVPAAPGDVRTAADVVVVIADSDGRPDRRGATVLAVGVAGLAPLRVTTADGGRLRVETLVDTLAAAAGVVLGQRGRGAPVAVLRGVDCQAGDDGVRTIPHR